MQMDESLCGQEPGLARSEGATTFLCQGLP